jgi:hypothetical protein
MCKIFGIINKNGNEADIKGLINAQTDELISQKDGISAIKIRKDNKIERKRSLDLYKTTIDWATEDIENCKLIALHARIGTSGVKDLSNVHFWERDGYYFAHNGYATSYTRTREPRIVPFDHNYIHDHASYEDGSRYEPDDELDWWGKRSVLTGETFKNKGEWIDELMINMDSCDGCNSAKKGVCKSHRPYLKLVSNKRKELLIEQTQIDKKKKGTKRGSKKIKPKEIKKKRNTQILKKCDSLQFIENIKKPITISEINKEIARRDFSGMAIVINKKTAETILTIQKQAYTLIGKGYSAFASYEPNKSIEETVIGTKYGIDYEIEDVEREIPVEQFEILQGTMKLRLP